MSSGPHDTHAAIDHDDHAFDGEPTDVLAEDEPRTPGWLPALGAVLFVSAAVAFLATREGSTPPAPEKAVAAVEAPQPQQRPAPAAAPAPPPAQPGAADTLRRLTPDQLRALQKQLEGMKAQQAAGAAPTPPQN